MKRLIELIAVATILVLAASTGVHSGVIDRDDSRPIDDMAEPTPVIPPDIPIVIDPPGDTPGEHYADFQLVGFTTETFAGNRGILNMSRACGRLFKHSRACSAAEIMKSVEIPEVSPGLPPGFAWVQAAGVGQMLDSGGKPVSDCNGWASASNRLYGWAIELGDPHGCYGGFMAESCDQELVVACCAIVEKEK